MHATAACRDCTTSVTYAPPILNDSITGATNTTRATPHTGQPRSFDPTITHAGVCVYYEVRDLLNQPNTSLSKGKTTKKKREQEQRE